MTSIDATTAAERPSAVIHPVWVRVTHWINAIAMLVMIGSGWEIYNASPLFGFSFPGSITLGGWLAGALLWHFAAMWVLAVNGIVYVRLAHDDLTVYNSVQRLLYAGIIAVAAVIVLSGLSIWKPVQLQWLTALFGGYDAARYVHFFCMAAICAFLVVHVALAVLVPKSLRAMIIGR